MKLLLNKQKIGALLLCAALLLGIFSGAGFAEESDTETPEPSPEESTEPTPEVTPDPGDGTIPLIDQEEWWLEQDWEDLRPFNDVSYGWLRLDLNLAELDRVGHQYGGQGCACYSLAYCRTLLDGSWHSMQEFNLGYGEADAYCGWYLGAYDSLFLESRSDVYERMYKELCEGNPLSVLICGPGTGHHYIAVVGFENVEKGKALDAGNFLIFDPCTESFEPENMGARGFVPKKMDNGYYQLLVDTSEASVRFEAHKSSYLSRCRVYPCSRLCVALNGAVLRSLPSTAQSDLDIVTVAELKPGLPFLAKALVKNQAGEYWYRGVTPAGATGYVAASLLTPGTPLGTLRAEDIELPALLEKGESFDLAGRIVAERCSFDSVCVSVYARGEERPRLSARIDRELGFCELAKSRIPAALRFESLAPGEYTLVVSVNSSSYFSADGKTPVREERSIRLLSLDFTVGETLPTEG